MRIWNPTGQRRSVRVGTFAGVMLPWGFLDVPPAVANDKAFKANVKKGAYLTAVSPKAPVAPAPVAPAPVATAPVATAPVATAPVATAPVAVVQPSEEVLEVPTPEDDQED